jgi:putative oxidoreductase
MTTIPAVPGGVATSSDAAHRAASVTGDRGLSLTEERGFSPAKASQGAAHGLSALQRAGIAIDREQSMQRIRNLAALIGRVGLGVIFMVHGYQKLAEWGIGGTSAAFAQMGVPAPMLSAWYAAVVELVGGAALVIGFALPVAGVLLALDMAGALVIVHLSHGFFIASNGYEYVLALAAASLAIGFNGGAFALDRLLFRNRTRAREPAVV